MTDKDDWPRSGMVAFHPDLAGLLAPIDDIRQHPDNPNNGSVEDIIDSIEVNGMYRPVYVQRSTGFILGGNSTWEACKALEATEIPQVMLDVDDVTATRILLVDNRTAALARMDHGIEVSLLQALAESDSLLGTGYTERDLASLAALTQMPAVTPTPQKWPKVCAEIPPEAATAYRRITDAAVGDTERFLLLLRLAGWADAEAFTG